MEIEAVVTVSQIYARDTHTCGSIPDVADARFAVYRSTDYQFYFIYRAANGEILVTSETYTTKQSALNGIASLKRDVAAAGIVDMTDKP